MSAGERAYRLLCGWTAQNAAKLCGRAPHSGAEVLGTLEGDRAYIIRTAFQRLLEEAGFSEEAVLSYLLEAGLAEGRSGHRTRSKRINGIATECVCLRLPPEDEA